MVPRCRLGLTRPRAHSSLLLLRCARCPGLLSWSHANTHARVRSQARMEEGLCRLAAAAITQRALANVKKRCVLRSTNTLTPDTALPLHAGWPTRRPRPFRQLSAAARRARV